jgi:hypothetical protein
MLDRFGAASCQNLTRHSACIDNSPRHSTPTKSTSNKHASRMAQGSARKITAKFNPPVLGEIHAAGNMQR